MEATFDEGARVRVRGKVFLVGAGPGDPDLLTVRAHRLVAGAEVLAYDELVSDEILALAPAACERIPVGRRARGCRHHEARIHPAVIARALAGRAVVRLKGGDPFVFGRGGEEAEELAAAQIPFEVVPGISAALGAAAATGIPLTHREVSRSVTFATAHATDGLADVRALGRDGTVVLYMGLGRLPETVSALIGAGWPPSTPVAVVARATLPDQAFVRATLADVVESVTAASLPTPALVIVGEVVRHRVAPTSAPAALHELVGSLRQVGS